MTKSKHKKSASDYKVGCLFDLHVPYGDPEALNIAVDALGKENLDELIVTEVPDFYAVSPWKKDPERMPFEEELELAYDNILWLDKEFSKVGKITYIKGNHEQRLAAEIMKGAKALAFLTQKGQPLSLPEILGFGNLDWNYIDNIERMHDGLGPYQIGKLHFIHGHEVKAGWGAVNLAKIYYDRCRCNVVVAHHHQCQEYIVRTLDNSHEGAWLVGCVSELSPTWMPHNNWVHGFAVITFDQDGNFSVHNRKIIGGKVL